MGKRYVNNVIQTPYSLIQKWMDGEVSLALHGLWRQSSRESALDLAYTSQLERVHRDGRRYVALNSFWWCLVVAGGLCVAASNWYPWLYSASVLAGIITALLLAYYFYLHSPRGVEVRKHEEAMKFIAFYDAFVRVTGNDHTDGFEKKSIEELKSGGRDALVSAALTVLKIEAINKDKNIPRVHWDAEHAAAAERFKEIFALMQALRLVEGYALDYGPYYTAAQALLDKSAVQTT